MSEALKIARLSASTQLTSQIVGLTTDPLWSTVLGFVAVHELRKRDLVGPVADDILYAGMIAINTARTPGLAGMVGSALGLENVLLPAAAGAVGARVFGRSAGGSAAGAAAGSVAKKSLLTKALPVAKVALPVTAAAAISVTAYDQIVKAGIPKKYKKAWTKIPFWKRALGATLVGTPIPLKEYAKNVAKIDRGEEL
jgi:hypothetical protein